MLPMWLVQAWLIISASRLVFGRLELEFLRRSTYRNGLIGFCAAVLILLGGVFVEGYFYSSLITGLSLSLSVVIVAQVWWTFRHFKLKRIKQTDILPTISVCIPARNEDKVLEDCLTTLLASDYPKLEVLVLDDCSQDKTAQIIRSFAHEGVRFVQGETPASGWLGKNSAMQTLAEQATGQWLLFMSVDTRLGPTTISTLINQAQTTKMQMLSLLPQDRLGVRLATIFSPLQYFWQAALPTIVPVSSKLWLIRSAQLKELGGFAGVKHKVIPEASFAKRLLARDAYRFYIAEGNLELTTAKSWRSQIETSCRLLYPLVKRQPFYALFGLLALGLLLAPFAAGPYWLITDRPALAAANIIAVFTLLIAYGLFIWQARPKSRLLSTLAFPLVVVQEMIILFISMLSYEFSQVNWKGRNVCYPVIAAPKRFYSKNHSG